MKQCERPFTANAPKKALPDLAGLFECALCHGGKGLMRNGCGFVYQFGCVGGRHKTGLVGRRAESHAALEHAVEEAFEGFGVGAGHVGIALWQCGGEIKAVHAADKIGGKRHAGRIGCGL